MYFISGIYILFLAATLVLYYLIPKDKRWICLLASSCFFYVWDGGYKTFGYMVFTSLLTFFAGILLEKLNAKKKNLPKEDKTTSARITKQKKLTVVAMCVISFGMLFTLKYLSFTVAIVDSFISKFGYELHAPSLLMPLGVSFYIFQSVGYVIDCYRGKHSVEHNYAKYALFVSFFPQIIQGPISRYNQLFETLCTGNDFNADNVRDGIQRMMWGYFKKMVIADRAAVVVSAFFSSYDSYGGAVTAFSVLMYCINLYCDFSGGIDITIGSALLFGVKMEENFRRPIFATSLSDYWRRWHITLGSWMRDYVFYPISLSKPFSKIGKWAREKLGGKIGKIFTTTLATFIVYIFIGIWHGANFRYIAYGFYNGAIITSSLLLAGVYSDLKKKLHIDADSVPWRVFSMLRTSFIVFIGRYITRSPRLIVAFQLILRTFTPSKFDFASISDGVLMKMGLSAQDYLIVGVSLAVMLLVEFYEEKSGHSLVSTLNKKHGALQWAAMTAMILVIVFAGIMRGSYISSEFIYKQY